MKVFVFALVLALGVSCHTHPLLAEALSLPAEAEKSETTDAPDDAGKPGVFSTFAKRIKDTWYSDEYDIYLPVYTWHNRLMYDSKKAAGYHEWPWGGGLGKSIRDEDGDQHFLFVMGFQDSHNRFEPYGGYAFQKNWFLDDAKDLSVGVGYTLGITAREQYDYIPFPLPLPIFGVQYKNLAVQAAYIPGGYNDGNVLFTWLRWHID